MRGRFHLDCKGGRRAKRLGAGGPASGAAPRWQPTGSLCLAVRRPISSRRAERQQPQLALCLRKLSEVPPKPPLTPGARRPGPALEALRLGPLVG
ncbi:hypothetical protein TgHK011_000800 [Trichoderma gracile]|nr:hypothetical protein TgHK011_000800 [Trichoderma gracile]